MKSNSNKIAISALILAAIVAVIIFVAPKQNTVNESAASILVTGPSGLTASVGDLQNINWKTFNYDGAKVSITLLKKVSNDPISYEVVRVISDETSNDGSATWVPSMKDIGDGILVQVGCFGTEEECVAGVSSSHLAVVNDNRFENTASVYKAIEDSLNR